MKMKKGFDLYYILEGFSKTFVLLVDIMYKTSPAYADRVTFRFSVLNSQKIARKK